MAVSTMTMTPGHFRDSTQISFSIEFSSYGWLMRATHRNGNAALLFSPSTPQSQSEINNHPFIIIICNSLLRRYRK